MNLKTMSYLTFIIINLLNTFFIADVTKNLTTDLWQSIHKAVIKSI